MSQLHPAPGAVSAFSDQVEVLRQALPHGAEFAIVIVFALALVIGAATRKVAKKLGFPYTIAMLGIGILCGIVVDPQFHELVEGVGSHGHHFGAKDLLVWALYDARSIRPDLIIFVFLPALIFESAYAIDLHTFKKTVGPAVVYAVPAMLISTLVTGLVAHRLLSVTGVDFDAHYIGEYAVVNGSLLVCLVFGALISATDPVADVALLSELGVSKKMSHLINKILDKH